MPSKWKYHADGVGTAVSTTQDLSGELTTVTIQLDVFKTRKWEPSGKDDERDINGEKIPDAAYYDEKKDVYQEHADGANATFKFTVDTGSATLKHIKPEDRDVFEPRHMAILPAVERVLANIDGVDVAPTPLQNLASYYDQAESVYIEQLDNE